MNEYLMEMMIDEADDDLHVKKHRTYFDSQFLLINTLHSGIYAENFCCESESYKHNNYIYKPNNTILHSKRDADMGI